MADNDDTHDWAADCDGEGQERAVRDGGDSGVVMVAVAAADGNGMRDWAAAYEGDGQERAARDGGDTEWQ